MSSGAIPTKIVNFANKEICKDLVNCINESSELKAAEIRPIFKKVDPLNKEN